ncbi:murein biosynthesis integral membrane protein MurJ [Alteraurantiacibacter aquimixticola]|uniref:Probable lipid II flippase MurJ n=1 Tax=Alteraurantiacibacter aquimixticola TaxID=2489173 RepID=A0A4T3F7T9_9SPHN|nr:murein biosynthesis integral membrane protein MurJ [Alteraurantiacibacter aquimixticola]TIX51060.1 murein biosynthesis integral membrane protein MurJ [Alteraurantiacibacter aquimixticola]
MGLLRNVGTISSLTLVSRIAGLAREMIFSRVLGANEATDAFLQAFILPNVFRRLFAEGAFSAAFVPMFSKRVQQGDDAGDDGHAQAAQFSNDVLSVFLPALIILCAIAEIAMPAIIWLWSPEWRGDADQLGFATDLARITFPYIALISLVTLFTGMLNSVSKFAPGASFPIILNLVLIAALLGGDYWMANGGELRDAVYLVAFAVSAAGVLQLLWLYYWTRVAGFKPSLQLPKVTPEVKRLCWIALPAAFGAGAYQINTLVQVYFLNALEGSNVTYMNYADRLNQLPLGIIGIALATAILPSLSRHIAAKDKAGASAVQTDAIELAMLLTLPAAVAMAICGVEFVTVFFQGGRLSIEDARIAGEVLVALVFGLPAYVLVKVLVPGFYARSDTRTPVYAALVALAFFIGFNIAFLQRFGVVGVAAASAVGAWLNCAILYAILVKRGHYHAPAVLLGRLAKQLVAAAAMGAALWFLRDAFEGWYAGNVFERVTALGVIAVAGAGIYFSVALFVGAIDRATVAKLIKRKAAK